MDLNFCKQCLETLEEDKTLFSQVWNSIDGVIEPVDAQQTLDFLFRITHGRILKMLGERVAQYYPTPKRYKDKLIRDALWWTFHCTGGINIKPVLHWFSGEPRAKRDGTGSKRPRGGSTHFAIEHDGTPWMFIKLTDGAWHCGGRNFDSLSVEFINACKLTLDEQYKRFRWWAGIYPLKYPAIKTTPWRNGEYWQGFDERQFVSMVKLMRLCSAALGEEKFDSARTSQHSDWNEKKVDCGPLFPINEIVRVGLGEEPLSSYDWFAALTKPDHPSWDEDTILSEKELQGLFNHLTREDEEQGEDLEEPAEIQDPVDRLKFEQTLLKSLGLYDGEVDGIFGPQTKLAVRAYQEKWNTDHPDDLIKVDGLIGPQTRGRMSTESAHSQGDGQGGHE